MPDEIYYYIGVAQHKNHLLDEAIANFKIAKTKVAPFHDLVSVTEKEINKEIESCEYAKYQISHPLDYEITNAGDNVNSSAPDYVPVISADESMLIFTTRRENVTGNKLDYFGKLAYTEQISKKMFIISDYSYYNHNQNDEKSFYDILGSNKTLNTTLSNTFNSTYQYHQVKSNEIIFDIAEKYNVSVTDLRTLNHITGETTIRKGMELKIRKK